MQQIPTTVSELELMLPHDWDYLVRTNRRSGKGYFCNITSPDFVAKIRIGREIKSESDGTTFPCYGDTLAAAISGAYLQFANANPELFQPETQKKELPAA